MNKHEVVENLKIKQFERVSNFKFMDSVINKNLKIIKKIAVHVSLIGQN